MLRRKVTNAMEKLKTLFLKYYEQIAYLFFGGVATLLNFVLLNVFQAVGGLALSLIHI